jgi:hypothetical protein
VRLSTGTTDETLAKEIAMKFAQVACTAREGRLTESRVREVIAGLYERTIGEPLHFRTARDYLAEWLENSRADTTVRTQARYKQTIDAFLAHVGKRTSISSKRVSPANMRQ